MAMTKTRTVQRIEVMPQLHGKPVVRAFYTFLIDDPDDDQLPIETTKVVDLFATAQDDPVNPSDEPTDVSGEDALVQAVTAAVWAD